MNGYHFVINNDSSKNRNVKPDINKLSTNKRCKILENIVIIDETSEQYPNGYCNVDFVFRLDPTNASFIYGIMELYSIMNLNLFLKCILPDLKSLCSLRFGMRSLLYFVRRYAQIQKQQVAS